MCVVILHCNYLFCLFVVSDINHHLISNTGSTGRTASKNISKDVQTIIGRMQDRRVEDDSVQAGG